MQPLQSILGKFVKDYRLEGGTVLKQIRVKWLLIVGKAVSAHTFPDMIKNHVLTINVDTPQWMHHLSFYKKEISDKLIPHKIQGIRFRLGKVPLPLEEEEREEFRELSDDDISFIENTLRNLKDEELKETFRKLMGHGLSRNKK